MLDFKLNPLCERHVPVSGLVVSMPAIGNTEFKTYFSMHFPKFRSLSHNIGQNKTYVINRYNIEALRA